MAGTYPDIPGARFALDQDGTIAKYRNYSTGSAWTDITGALNTLQLINTSQYVDISIGNSTQTCQISLAFPETRNISGLYIHFGCNSGGYNATLSTCEYSTDTQDGTDGTWSTFIPSFALYASHCNIVHNSRPYYRSDIAPVSLTNVKGLRIRFVSGGGSETPRAFVLHLYGSRPQATANRVAFWHPTLDQAISGSALDFGDMAQGTTLTRQVRVKNISSSLTANGVSVSVSDLLPEYPTNELQVSPDNVTYGSSASLGTINSGSISGVFYVRRTVAAAESTILRHARLLVNASSWT